MAGPRRDLPALTSVRFFAATHVVIFHYGQPILVGAPAALVALAGNGYVGVSFFFVLSGFILAYTYASALREGWVRPFLAARFARVYPMYLVALAVTGVLLAASHPTATRDQIVVSGVASALLVQSWIPSWVGVWNVPGWSLSVEAVLYLAFPAIFPWLLRRSRPALALSASIATVVAMVPPMLYAVVDPDHLGGAVAAGRTPLLDFVKYCPALHIAQFAVGVACGCGFARRAESRAGARVCAVASVVLAPAIIGVLCVPFGRLFPVVHDGLLAPLFGAFVYALAVGRGPLARLLAARPLVLLGRASYAMYLLQHPVWIAVATALRHAHVKGRAAFLVPFGCLLFASVVSLFAIEEPARRWLRRVLAVKPRAALAPRSL